MERMKDVSASGALFLGHPYYGGGMLLCIGTKERLDGTNPIVRDMDPLSHSFFEEFELNVVKSATDNLRFNGGTLIKHYARGEIQDRFPNRNSAEPEIYKTFLKFVKNNMLTSPASESQRELRELDEPGIENLTLDLQKKLYEDMREEVFDRFTHDYIG